MTQLLPQLIALAIGLAVTLAVKGVERLLKRHRDQPPDDGDQR